MPLLELELRGLYIDQVIKVVVASETIYRLIVSHEANNITERDQRWKRSS